MLLANNQGKASGTGNSLDFDEVAKDVWNKVSLNQCGPEPNDGMLSRKSATNIF